MRFRQYSLILSVFTWCALIGIVCAASDCGCGGLPDSGPPSGWSDAGNAAMSSYSGFGGSGGGTGTTTSADQGSPGGTDSGLGSSSGTGSGSGNSGSSGSVSSGSSAGSYSDEAVKLTSLGIDLFRQGDFNKSLDSLNRSLTLDPYSEKTWTVKGDVLLAMDRGNESLAAYTQALHLDQADPVIYSKIGDAQIKTGAYKAAVASYDHALALQPDFPSAAANRTIAVELASGLVAMPATTGPSPAATYLMATRTSIPDVTGTHPSDSTAITTQASLPAAGVLPAFGIVMIFFLIKRRKTGK